MVTYINKFSLLITILVLIIMLPGGLALAESRGQEAATPTLSTLQPATSATPSVEISMTEMPTATSTPQIPRLVQTEIQNQIPDTTEVLSFKDFGFEERTLRGPFATNAYYFDLPPTWKMKEGAQMQLVLDIFYTSNSSDPQDLLDAAYGGTLLIQYNYVTIAAIDLNQEGQQTVVVPIALDVLTRLPPAQSHSIQFILDSGVNCDVNFRTTVIVRSQSQLYLPHEQIDPPVDLRLLPTPFFQDSFNQDSVIIVVPDQPTAAELQAALSVSAGFGRMTFNRLLISLLPLSQVSPDMLGSTNLIFIGKADGLPLLQQVSLSVPVSGGAFVAENVSPTDGMVQMAVSPWNKSKVVMAVVGNDDQAVINAARAMSTGALRVGSNPSLSLVSNVQLAAPKYDPANAEQTFDDLGYDSIVVGQVGLNTITYAFDVPQNYTLGSDAYVELVFSHTSLLEYQRSNAVVKLNEEPIGSVRLSETTSGQGAVKILLPASAVRPGTNRLRLDIYLEASNDCVNPLLDGLWMRIDSASVFYLPFVPNLASSSILVDLSRYPSPFAFDPVMNDLAFVLPTNDPISWNIASQIAFSLGNTNAIQLAGLEAFFADSIPDVVRQERNLIIVGKPSDLGILSELYDVLPAPFESGTNWANEKNLQISYHLDPEVDAGYLELLSAPWNSKLTVLYVGGSSDLGVQWAGNVLRLGSLRSQLNGNLAFINGEQILTADTRTLRGTQNVLPEVTQMAATQAAVDPQVVAAQRPEWILPAILASVGGIILVLIIVGAQAVGRRRSNR